MPHDPDAPTAVGDARGDERAHLTYETTFAPYFDYVEHAPTRPAIVDGAEATATGDPHPVVIVGGGPTGLALALGLANHGVASVVLEHDTTVCSGSRAGAITRRTLQIFDRLGVLEPMLEKGFAWSGGITYLGREEIFRFEAPPEAHQPIPASISLQQNYVEQFLVDEIERRPDLIELRWGSTVTGIERFDDHVELTVAAGGEAYRTSAEWLVACDGARSVVRRSLGLSLNGRNHEGRYIIIDIKADTRELPVGRRCWFDPPSNPGSTLLMYKKPDDMLRLDFQMLPDEDADEAMQPERVVARVRDHLGMIGVSGDWHPVWMSMYRASALTLDQYCHGRVIFAGDAAHLIPIFGVRGMNSCIDDTHNLAWKLAAICRGAVGPVAGQRLLQSYADERRYAAIENIRLASRGADFMSPPGSGSRLLRDAVLALAREVPDVRSLINPRQHSAIPLVESPLNLFPERSAELSEGPVPGDLMPDGPLARGELTSSIAAQVGTGFAVVTITPDGTVSSALRAAIDQLAQLPVAVGHVAIASGAPADLDIWHDVAGVVAPRCGASDHAVYLVRPDGHVLARWRQAQPAELLDAMRSVIEGSP